jgi:uncharacterized protein (DUF2147 family)
MRSLYLLRILLAALCFCGSLLIVPPARADTDTPVGSWIRADGETVFVIEYCNTGLCGRIAGMSFDHPTDPQPLNWQGQPMCNEKIISVSPEYGMRNQWHGFITNPKSGNVWQATLTLVNGALQLHGYFGLPLFGRTETWTRFTGQIAAQCHISAAG